MVSRLSEFTAKLGKLTLNPNCKKKKKKLYKLSCEECYERQGLSKET